MPSPDEATTTESTHNLINNFEEFVEGIKISPKSVFEAVLKLAESSRTSRSNLETALDRIKKLEQESHTNPNFNDNGALESLLKQILSERGPPKSTKIPDPSIFSGDKREFFIWKEAILLKLNANSDHFPTQQSKMAFIFSRLSPSSQAHLQGWVENGIILFPSAELMMKTLGIIFDDPNRKRDSVARLHSNMQRNRPFSSWIAEMRRDAAIAGYNNDSYRLKDLILMNMSLELKQALIYEREIDSLDLDETVSRLQDIDNRQRAFASAAARTNPRQNRYTQWTPASSNQTQPLPGDPMDLSATISKRRGPLSQEEKDRRRQQGLCLYCADSGHQIRYCPQKPSTNSIAGRVIDLQEVKTGVSENAQAL